MSETFDKLKDTFNARIVNSYGRFDIALDSGKNATAVDIDGNTVIDFTSGIGVNSLGFADEGWAAAIAKQAGKLQHISNLYYTQPCMEVAQLLCEKTGFDKVFFCNSGAEANEGAIKIARKYSFDKYGKGRATIITLENSFHGRTITTLAATGQEHFHDFFFPFTEGFCYAKANDIDSVKAQLNDSVCAVMIELIQGEGGVIPLDAGFVANVGALCKEHDLLLIVDEVQTGIARTGKLLCAQQYGIMPDVVTLAKGLGGGLPIGAILTNAKVSAVLGLGQHGTTFGGNPVVCAGAAEILHRVSTQEFLAEVTAKGEYIRGKLSDIPEITAINGMGLMLGLALATKKASEVAKQCVEEGLLILTAKENLRMLPPLTITYAEIDKGLEILKRVLCSH